MGGFYFAAFSVAPWVLPYIPMGCGAPHRSIAPKACALVPRAQRPPCPQKKLLLRSSPSSPVASSRRPSPSCARLYISSHPLASSCSASSCRHLHICPIALPPLLHLCRCSAAAHQRSPPSHWRRLCRRHWRRLWRRQAADRRRVLCGGVVCYWCVLHGYCRAIGAAYGGDMSAAPMVCCRVCCVVGGSIVKVT